MAGVTYDEECGPNYFTLSACSTGNPADMYTWEISEFRDDRQSLLQWFAWLQLHQIEMTGFNNLAYDYVLAHYLFMHPEATYQELYQLSQQVINSNQDEKFSSYTIWQSDRFAPQVDLYKIHHFDNNAKRTSLKALQFAMRSPSVVEMPIPFNVPVTRDRIRFRERIAPG